MIEINLLPPHKRVPEGTPPARMATILVSVLFSFIGMLLTVNDQLEEWNKDTQIKNVEDDIKNLKDKLAEIKKKKIRIEEAKAKLKVIDDLLKDRLRWNRLLFRIAQVLDREDMKYATLEDMSFSRKGPKVKVILKGWISAGIGSLEEEKEDGYYTRLFNAGYKLLAAYNYYTGAYHTEIATEKELKENPDMVKELAAIKNFIGGTFSKWQYIFKPERFRIPSRLRPKATEGYMIVMPQMALKFQLTSEFTRTQIAKPRTTKKKRGKR